MTPGLLNEDDNGQTDLGTLEKQLSEKNALRRASQLRTSGPTSPSVTQDGSNSTPQSALTSPEPQPPREVEKTNGKPESKRKEDEIEGLSDMMCSLVTNNCGETRYIGKRLRAWYTES